MWPEPLSISVDNEMLEPYFISGLKANSEWMGDINENVKAQILMKTNKREF
jgi:hypothetical protein